jgi:hypothetical protein
MATLVSWLRGEWYTPSEENPASAVATPAPEKAPEKAPAKDAEK